MTPKPLLRLESFCHQQACDEPGVWEVRAYLAHQLEDIRILSISNDGFGGLERAICSKRGSSKGSGIGLGQERHSTCCSGAYLPIN